MEVTTQTIKEFTLNKDEITQAIIEYIQKKKAIGLTDTFHHMTQDILKEIEIDTSSNDGIRGITIIGKEGNHLTYVSKVCAKFVMTGGQIETTKVKM